MGSLDDLLQIGSTLRVAAIGTYAAAFVGYAASLAARKLRAAVGRAATILAVLGITAHTAYLASRWVAAGQVEILARVRTGDVLSSYDRFWLFLSHPPYTNLFDALNFTAWALVICYLIVERKWGLRVVGALAMAIALVAMGEAALVSDQGIEPLVPALQSYWILIHVGMLFVSYALFTVGAVAALLFLVRSGVAMSVLGAAQAALAALMLAVVGGSPLLTRGVFEMAPGWVHQIPSRLTPGKMLTTVSAVHYFAPGAEKAQKLQVAVPWVGPFILLAFALLAAGALVFWLRDRKADANDHKAIGFAITAAGFAALTVGLGVLLWHIASGGEVTIPAGTQLVPGERGPFRFTIASNYALGVLALLWGSTLGYLLTVVFRERIVPLIPEARKLEDVTYRVVIAGWPLLTVGIVMGGMWANEAWGRFWGWDPKETWALITWVVYAGYLHTRITLGWTGKRTAAIAVGAFAVVIFTFLGVNLGLTGDGLHTYGAG